MYLYSAPEPRPQNSDTRVLRERQRAIDQRRDASGAGGRIFGSSRRLVQVYNAGDMPASNDHFFATHPVEINGSETEGGAGTPVVDTSTTLYVDVLGTTVPSVGDILTAYAVGGRWVAERGSGGCGCCSCLCPNGDPMPHAFTFTLSGGDITYGPFTIPAAACGCLWRLATTITIQPYGPCPAIENVMLTLVVAYSTVYGWNLSIEIDATYAFFDLAPDGSPVTPVYCSGETLNYYVSCFGYSLTGNPGIQQYTASPNGMITLGSCPTSSFNLSGNFWDHFSGTWVDELAFYYLFGLPCTSGSPYESPFPAATFSLSAVAGAPPKGAGAGTMCQMFAIWGCGSFVYPGITVTVKTSQTGTILASGVTGSDGQLYLTWTGASGNYWVEYTGQSSRFADPSGTVNLVCGATTNLAMRPAPGYCCSTVCLLPIKSTLTITFSGSAGTVTLTCDSNTGWLATLGDDNYVSVSGIGLGLTLFQDPSPSCQVTGTTILSCSPSVEVEYTMTGCSLYGDSATLTE